MQIGIYTDVLVFTARIVWKRYVRPCTNSDESCRAGGRKKKRIAVKSVNGFARRDAEIIAVVRNWEKTWSMDMMMENDGPWREGESCRVRVRGDRQNLGAQYGQLRRLGWPCARTQQGGSVLLSKMGQCAARSVIK